MAAPAGQGQPPSPPQGKTDEDVTCRNSEAAAVPGLGHRGVPHPPVETTNFAVKEANEFVLPSTVSQSTPATPEAALQPKLGQAGFGGLRTGVMAPARRTENSAWTGDVPVKQDSQTGWDG